MLFQDRIVEVLKGSQGMTIKSLQNHIESIGVKAAYGAVKQAIIQLEKFDVVSPTIVEGSGWLGYKLNDNYENGLEKQALVSKRCMVRKHTSKHKENSSKVTKLTYGSFNQVGEPARLHLMFNELLAKPRAKRIKRGLAV